MLIINTVELKIKNQPFSFQKLNGENYTNLYYIVNYKGHYEGNWSVYDYDLKNDWFLTQSTDSQYTIVNFGQLPTEGQVDYRVQARIGYFVQYFTPFRVHEFTGQTGDWSNIQTISIPDGKVTISASSNPTFSPSPSPSVPEFSWLAILPILLTIPIALAIVRKRL